MTDYLVPGARWSRRDFLARMAAASGVAAGAVGFGARSRLRRHRASGGRCDDQRPDARAGHLRRPLRQALAGVHQGDRDQGQQRHHGLQRIDAEAGRRLRRQGHRSRRRRRRLHVPQGLREGRASGAARSAHPEGRARRLLLRHAGQPEGRLDPRRADLRPGDRRQLPELHLQRRPSRATPACSRRTPGTISSPRPRRSSTRPSTATASSPARSA